MGGIRLTERTQSAGAVVHRTACFQQDVLRPVSAVRTGAKESLKADIRHRIARRILIPSIEVRILAGHQKNPK